MNIKLTELQLACGVAMAALSSLLTVILHRHLQALLPLITLAIFPILCLSIGNWDWRFTLSHNRTHASL